MKTLANKTKSLSPLLGLLALVVVFTIAPHAFALTTADDPHGPMESTAWIAAVSVAGIMSSVGFLTTVRLGKLFRK